MSFAIRFSISRLHSIPGSDRSDAGIARNGFACGLVIESPAGRTTGSTVRAMETSVFCQQSFRDAPPFRVASEIASSFKRHLEEPGMALQIDRANQPGKSTASAPISGSNTEPAASRKID